MIRSKSLPLKALSALLALAAGALPNASHAACTPIDSTYSLGQVSSASQFRAKQGEAVNGSLVRGVAGPVTVRLEGCSTTLPTTVRVDRVVISKDGHTFTLIPWLLGVGGVNLTTPKDLSLVTHEFLGNVTLDILLVPDGVPHSLRAGQYTGPLTMHFTD